MVDKIIPDYVGSFSEKKGEVFHAGQQKLGGKFFNNTREKGKRGRVDSLNSV